LALGSFVLLIVLVLTVHAVRTSPARGIARLHQQRLAGNAQR
jgi:hypothetical protein